MSQNQSFLVVFVTEVFLSASIVSHSSYRNPPTFHSFILLLFHQLTLPVIVTIVLPLLNIFRLHSL